MSVEAPQFYDDDTSLFTYIDGLRQGSAVKTPGPAKAKKQYKNPILPDGTVKRGRPRKSAATLDVEQETPTKPKSVRGRKRKRGDDDASEVIRAASPQPTRTRKRGGPSTQQSNPEPLEPSTDAQGGPGEGGISVSDTGKHGRPPRRKQREVAVGNSAPITTGVTTSSDPIAELPAPKRRGRPRKHPLPSDGANATAASAATAESGTITGREDSLPIGPLLCGPDAPTETLVTTGAGGDEATQQRENHITAEGESTQVAQQTRQPATALNAAALPSATLAVQPCLQHEEAIAPLQGTGGSFQTESTNYHSIQESTSEPPAMSKSLSGQERDSGVPPALVETLLHGAADKHPEIPIDPALLLEPPKNGPLVPDNIQAGVRI